MRATGPKQTQRPGGMQDSNGDDAGMGTANQGEFCGSRGRDALAPRRIEDYPAAPIFVQTERYTFFFWYTFSECPPGSKTAVLNWLSTHTKK